MSFRITVNEIDRSQTLIPDINNVGAMVVRSERGPTEPTFISAAQEQRILDLYGYPDSTRPDVIEAIEFNKIAPLWMVAASDLANDKYAGLLVQADMDSTDFAGFTAGDIASYAFADSSEYFLLYTKFPTGKQFLRGTVTRNTTRDTFTILIGILRNGLYEEYDTYEVSLTPGATGDYGVGIYIEDVFEDNELLGVMVNDSALIDGVDTTVTNENVATGDGSADQFTFTLTNDNVSPTTVVIYDEGVEVANDDTGTFGVITGTAVNGTIDYLTGLVDITFDVAPDNQDAITVDYTYNTGNGFYAITDPIAFTGGTKAADLDAFVINSWNEFQSHNKYPAKIFMDVSTLDTVPAVFDTLRNTYQKYASYILPLPLTDTATNAITTKSGYGLNNRGISVYWNHGLVQYAGNKFYSPLTGRVGRKYAAMVNVFNGLAPAWRDENNHGGQLGSGISEMYYDPTENELEQLDSAGINPIIFDPSLGPVITSQKTAKSPTFVSDDSYIGHSRLFDTIISNIVNQVLNPQITKLNDEAHRRTAFILGDTFMRPMKDPSIGLLNNYKIKCDLGNNDDTARSQRKFVYSVAVQVTPFSEFIVFNFIKVGQTISVDSVLA